MYIHIFSADTNKCVMTIPKGIPYYVSYAGFCFN